MQSVLSSEVLLLVGHTQVLTAETLEHVLPVGQPQEAGGEGGRQGGRGDGERGVERGREGREQERGRQAGWR